MTPSAQTIVASFIEDLTEHISAVAYGRPAPDFEPQIVKMTEDLTAFCDVDPVGQLATSARMTITATHTAVAVTGAGALVLNQVESVQMARVRATAAIAVATGPDAAPLREQLDEAEGTVAAAEAHLTETEQELELAVVSGDVDKVLSLRTVVLVTGPDAVASAKAARADLLIALAEVPTAVLADQADASTQAWTEAMALVDDLEAELQRARDAVTQAERLKGIALGAQADNAGKIASLRAQRDADSIAAAERRTAAMRRLAGMPDGGSEGSASTVDEEQSRQAALAAGRTFFRVEDGSQFVEVM